MDKGGLAVRKTFFISIFAILLLSLFAHYTSDAFPPAHRGVPDGMRGNNPEGSMFNTDAQVSHPLHTAFLWAEPVVLGILIGLTYALIASSSNHKFLSFPPPDRPPIIEPYSL